MITITTPTVTGQSYPKQLVIFINNQQETRDYEQQISLLIMAYANDLAVQELDRIYNSLSNDLLEEWKKVAEDWNKRMQKQMEPYKEAQRSLSSVAPTIYAAPKDAHLEPLKKQLVPLSKALTYIENRESVVFDSSNQKKSVKPLVELEKLIPQHYEQAANIAKSIAYSNISVHLDCLQSGEIEFIKNKVTELQRIKAAELVKINAEIIKFNKPAQDSADGHEMDYRHTPTQPSQATSPPVDPSSGVSSSSEPSTSQLSIPVSILDFANQLHGAYFPVPDPSSDSWGLVQEKDFFTELENWPQPFGKDTFSLINLACILNNLKGAEQQYRLSETTDPKLIRTSIEYELFFLELIRGIKKACNLEAMRPVILAAVKNTLTRNAIDLEKFKEMLDPEKPSTNNSVNVIKKIMRETGAAAEALQQVGQKINETETLLARPYIIDNEAIRAIKTFINIYYRHSDEDVKNEIQYAAIADVNALTTQVLQEIFKDKAKALLKDFRNKRKQLTDDPLLSIGNNGLFELSNKISTLKKFIADEIAGENIFNNTSDLKVKLRPFEYRTDDLYMFKDFIKIIAYGRVCKYLKTIPEYSQELDTAVKEYRRFCTTFKYYASLSEEGLQLQQRAILYSYAVVSAKLNGPINDDEAIIRIQDQPLLTQKGSITYFGNELYKAYNKLMDELSGVQTNLIEIGLQSPASSPVDDEALQDQMQQAITYDYYHAQLLSKKEHLDADDIKLIRSLKMLRPNAVKQIYDTHREKYEIELKFSLEKIQTLDDIIPILYQYDTRVENWANPHKQQALNIFFETVCAAVNRIAEAQLVTIKPAEFKTASDIINFERAKDELILEVEKTLNTLPKSAQMMNSSSAVLRKIQMQSESQITSLENPQELENFYNKYSRLSNITALSRKRRFEVLVKLINFSGTVPRNHISLSNEQLAAYLILHTPNATTAQIAAVKERIANPAIFKSAVQPPADQTNLDAVDRAILAYSTVEPELLLHQQLRIFNIATGELTATSRPSASAGEAPSDYSYNNLEQGLRAAISVNSSLPATHLKIIYQAIIRYEHHHLFAEFENTLSASGFNPNDPLLEFKLVVASMAELELGELRDFAAELSGKIKGIDNQADLNHAILTTLASVLSKTSSKETVIALFIMLNPNIPPVRRDDKVLKNPIQRSNWQQQINTSTKLMWYAFTDHNKLKAATSFWTQVVSLLKPKLATFLVQEGATISTDEQLLLNENIGLFPAIGDTNTMLIISKDKSPSSYIKWSDTQAPQNQNPEGYFDEQYSERAGVYSK